MAGGLRVPSILRTGGPTNYLSESPESQAAFGALETQRGVNDADIARAGAAKADAARAVTSFDTGGQQALQDYQGSIKPVEEFQPRQVSGQEMMDFAGLAMIVSTLGSRVVRGDAAMGLNGAAAAMRGYNEGNMQQARLDMDNFRTRMDSVVRHNSAMLDRYNTIMSDRRLSLQQKMQQYSIAAHEYQDTIALSALKEGRLQQVLERNDRIRAGMNQMDSKIRELDYRAWLAEQKAAQKKPEILHTDKGVYRIDPNTGLATTVTLASGEPLPGKPAPVAAGAKPPAEIMRMSIALGAMDKAIDNYEKLLAKFDPRSFDQLSPTQRAKLDSAVSALQLEWKEAAQLGALTGPDLEIMERTIVNPSTVKGAYYGQEGLGEQITEARGYMQRRKQSVQSMYPSLNFEGEPKRITSDAEFNALPSGTEFIGPDGKRRRKP